jgi:hypothetical protein
VQGGGRRHEPAAVQCLPGTIYLFFSTLDSIITIDSITRHLVCTMDSSTQPLIPYHSIPLQGLLLDVILLDVMF